MPYKSKSQVRAFFAMQERGEIPEGTAERWADETKSFKKLPEKVKKRKMKKSASFNSGVISGFSDELSKLMARG